MHATLSRLGHVGAVTLCLAAAALPFEPGALATSVGPTKIGPHQVFDGLVNGKSDDAVVKVVCGGPASFGHALPGQTLAVTSPAVIATNSGETGSRARSIAANVPGSATAVTVLFKEYNRPTEFPTNIDLPCSGTDVLIFAPVPGSPSAKAATVTVAFANVGVTAR